MAECSYARCVQQRRNIRRELQRWTRNMVHIVGLERIAEELMGRRKWKLYQESMSRNYLQPLNNNVKEHQHNNNNNNNNNHHHQNDRHHEDKDTFISSPKREEEDGEEGVKQEKENERRKKEEVEERLKDWTPETKCYFCVDGKLDSEHSHGVLSPRHTDSDTSDSPPLSDSEAPPTLTPSSNNHHRGAAAAPSNMTTLDSVTSMALAAAAFSAGGVVAPPHSNVGGAAAATPLPFYAPSIFSHNWYLANVARSLQESTNGGGGGGGGSGPGGEKGAGGEQPLDLSKGANNNHVDARSNVRLPGLDTKHIFKAKPRMSAVAGRRTYTEDELQAALRDIQSGKLGTRRAAVIYGIPRSTLRNKVYKLAMERERESHLNSSTPLKLEEEEVIDDDKELSGAEEEKEVEKALQTPLMDILRYSNTEIPQEALKAFIQKDGFEGEYLQNLILASQNLLPKPLEVPEFLKKVLSEETKNNGDNNCRPNSANKLPPKSESSDMETEETSSNVILKIPSFKPASSKNGDLLASPPITSGDSNSPPSLPATPKGMTIKDVKDVIAQSISQKFQQNLVEPRRNPIIDMDYKRGGFTPPLASGGISVIKTQDLRPYQPPPKPQNAPTTGGKGTRPKRGKYRNYDRDSLVEAVRAVQRGEMSVHRAGSYYGVPHSTLEYKVKERHLMRPRKRDPKPNPVDEKIATLKQNDKLIKPPPALMKPPPPTKFPPTGSPNGMKLPMFEPMPAGYTPPPFPFWPHHGFPHIPLEYGRPPPTTPLPTPNAEFFASQMMQKLQEESKLAAPLAKSARQIAESLLDGSGANGSFLDGIIRSSLESGVPEEKGAKEENAAVENMSNKALLDQLCRNSRLTPMPEAEQGASPGEGANSKEAPASPLPSIELSNDSTSDKRPPSLSSTTPPPRIYLKKDLANPDNLQPEKLMCFRGEHNGGIEVGSASSCSDNDAMIPPQD